MKILLAAVGIIAGITLLLYLLIFILAAIAVCLGGLPT